MLAAHRTASTSVQLIMLKEICLSAAPPAKVPGLEVAGGQSHLYDPQLTTLIRLDQAKWAASEQGDF
jgi:hypothetical protein